MTQTDLSAFPLKPLRMHEACGPGARFFALAQAAQMGGTVLWIQEAWQSHQINPLGFSAMLDPARLLIATPADAVEAQAVAEDSLRSGAVTLVISEITKPLSLTAGRRLQLAAQEGGATGLALIPEGMGSNAAETRWRCRPVFDSPLFENAVSKAADSTLHHWDLIKNKSGTLRAWHVRWAEQTRRITVVPEAGQRPGSQAAPG